MLLRGTAGIDPRPVWPLGRQNVTVTYEHGYDTLDIPEDVRLIAINIASRVVIQGVAKSESVGDVSVTYAAASADLTPGEHSVTCRAFDIAGFVCLSHRDRINRDINPWILCGKRKNLIHGSVRSHLFQVSISGCQRSPALVEVFVR